MADDISANPAQLINRASRALARLGDAGLRPLGLRFGQIPVVAALRGGRSLTQSELARLARIEQPSMAQMLTRMERDGLITRQPDPRDARSRPVTLTQLAEDRTAQARAVLAANSAAALAGFSAAETATLSTLLGRLNDNLDRLESTPPDS